MTYQWQKSNLPVEKLEDLLENRRKELLHILPLEGQINLYDLEEKLISEWVLLLEKRDEVVQERVKLENEKLLMDRLQSLQKLLTTIGEFDLNQLPGNLHTSLGTLYKNLQQFLSDKKFDISDPEKDSCLDDDTYFSISESPCSSQSSISTDETSDFQTPLSSPIQADLVDDGKDPPESSRSADAVAEEVLTHVPTTENSAGASGSSLPKRIPLKERHIQRLTPSNTSTPKVPTSTDLRKSLLKSRQALRSTPGVQRSPGGTPNRKAPRLDLSNKGDLITYALHKKFKNVRKLYTSPSADGPSSNENSFNISID